MALEIHGESGMPIASAVTVEWFESLFANTSERPIAGSQRGLLTAHIAQHRASAPAKKIGPRHFRGIRGIRLDAILSRRLIVPRTWDRISPFESSGMVIVVV